VGAVLLRQKMIQDCMENKSGQLYVFRIFLEFSSWMFFPYDIVILLRTVALLVTCVDFESFGRWPGLSFP